MQNSEFVQLVQRLLNKTNLQQYEQDTNTFIEILKVPEYVLSLNNLLIQNYPQNNDQFNIFALANLVKCYEQMRQAKMNEFKMQMLQNALQVLFLTAEKPRDFKYATQIINGLVYGLNNEQMQKALENTLLNFQNQTGAQILQITPDNIQETVQQLTINQQLVFCEVAKVFQQKKNINRVQLQQFDNILHHIIIPSQLQILFNQTSTQQYNEQILITIVKSFVLLFGNIPTQNHIDYIQSIFQFSTQLFTTMQSKQIQIEVLKLVLAIVRCYSRSHGNKNNILFQQFEKVYTSNIFEQQFQFILNQLSQINKYDYQKDEEIVCLLTIFSNNLEIFGSNKELLTAENLQLIQQVVCNFGCKILMEYFNFVVKQEDLYQTQINQYQFITDYDITIYTNMVFCGEDNNVCNQIIALFRQYYKLFSYDQLLLEAQQLKMQLQSISNSNLTSFYHISLQHTCVMHNITFIAKQQKEISQKYNAIVEDTLVVYQQNLQNQLSLPPFVINTTLWCINKILQNNYQFKLVEYIISLINQSVKALSQTRTQAEFYIFLTFLKARMGDLQMICLYQTEDIAQVLECDQLQVLEKQIQENQENNYSEQLQQLQQNAVNKYFKILDMQIDKQVISISFQLLLQHNIEFMYYQDIYDLCYSSCDIFSKINSEYTSQQFNLFFQQINQSLTSNSAETTEQIIKQYVKLLELFGRIFIYREAEIQQELYMTYLDIITNSFQFRTQNYKQEHSSDIQIIVKSMQYLLINTTTIDCFHDISEYLFQFFNKLIMFVNKYGDDVTYLISGLIFNIVDVFKVNESSQQIFDVCFSYLQQLHQNVLKTNLDNIIFTMRISCIHLLATNEQQLQYSSKIEQINYYLSAFTSYPINLEYSDLQINIVMTTAYILVFKLSNMFQINILKDLTDNTLIQVLNSYISTHFNRIRYNYYNQLLCDEMKQFIAQLTDEQEIQYYKQIMQLKDIKNYKISNDVNPQQLQQLFTISETNTQISRNSDVIDLEEMTGVFERIKLLTYEIKESCGFD